MDQVLIKNYMYFMHIRGLLFYLGPCLVGSGISGMALAVTVQVANRICIASVLLTVSVLRCLESNSK